MSLSEREFCCNDCEDDGGWACDCDDGLRLICIDDICRSRGECFHGDGYALCRRCDGSGWIECSCARAAAALGDAPDGGGKS